MHHNALSDVLLLLAASVLAVTLFRRLNLPPIMAYIGVGALIGPHALGWVEDTENTRLLAEFGVVFLLFTLGLEFSLTKLVAMRRAVLGMGGAQVLITTLVAGGVAWGLGLSIPAALVVGGVLAMSSTAMVIKLLAEQIELNSRHGRAAVGILLFQDLAVIPFLILIPALANGGDHIGQDLAIAMLKGVVVTGILIVAGRWLLRPMFNEIAKARSPELFTLAVLLVALSSAALTYTAGLSMALGAFLAGIMLSETAFRHQIESDIRPFQDVLLGLFFITIGMLLDMQALPQYILPALGLLVVLVLMKALIIFGVGVALREEPGVALRAGLVLAQGGEFGFALLALASRGNLLAHEAVQVVLTAVLLSMLTTPFLVRYNGRVTKLLVRGYQRSFVEQREEIAQQTAELEGHVILTGFGRVGQNLAYLLDQEDIPYIALEVDPDIIEKAQRAGYNVHFANATHIDLLRAAGIDKARALVITHHDAAAAIRTLNVVRLHYKDLPVLVRVLSVNQMDEIIEAGATDVVRRLRSQPDARHPVDDPDRRSDAPCTASYPAHPARQLQSAAAYLPGAGRHRGRRQCPARRFGQHHPASGGVGGREDPRRGPGRTGGPARRHPSRRHQGPDARKQHTLARRRYPHSVRCRERTGPCGIPAARRLEMTRLTAPFTDVPAHKG